MRLLLPLVACLLSNVDAANERVTVSLNFGWRTTNHLGCDSSAAQPLNDVKCQGLTLAPGVTDATQCQAAACDTDKAVWQFLPATGCWVGFSQDCSQVAKGWVGASYMPSPDSPEAAQSFDDSAWEVVDIPHDATVTGSYNVNASEGEGFLPPVRTWYRKNFVIPTSWKGQSVALVADAALSTTSWWLNGKQVTSQNPAGYLPYVLSLDAHGLVADGTTKNVLVAFVDGSITTGWWYEGSGLVRGARLVKTSPQVSVAPFGISSPSFVQGAIHSNSDSPAGGLRGDLAFLSPTASLQGSSTASVAVKFELVASDGVTVVANGTATGKAGTTVSPKNSLRVTDAQLWSVPRPYLYTLRVTVLVSGAITDVVTETIGIRNIAWDAERGLVLNEQNVKMRGACNHESFTGVGAALPARVDLFRLQQMRGVGMNAWRTSHNPPEPVLLDLADRLGVLVLDENRVLATQENCIGDGCNKLPRHYAGDPAADMGALALRDRNHASVAWYSLCNEAGCGNGTLLEGDLVEYAKQASYDFDGARAVGANMGWKSPTSPRTPMSDALDVMGMSHTGMEVVVSFHQREPGKPLVMTECCSCLNQRGEDSDTTKARFANEVSECLDNQVSVSDHTEYVAGTFVWTLHDYMGEPGDWPHVSSSFGAIDLAGFPKAPAWWYRARWLANISASDPGRPPLSHNVTVRIVESWAPNPNSTTREINVYSNAPLVQLFLNGQSQGSPVSLPSPSRPAKFNVTYAAGSLTAKALAPDGTSVIAEHSTSSWGNPSRLSLTMDVPSLDSGTGQAVFVDGEDVALLRASVLDVNGAVVRDSTLNISFAVSSGPGFIAGVGNGDPTCQEPSQVDWRSAYHGLARVIVRVTMDLSGSDTDRQLRATVNVEAGLSSRSSKILPDASNPPKSIIVTASAPGLPSTTFTVPLSTDPADSVLAVASASIGSADLGKAD